MRLSPTSEDFFSKAGCILPKGDAFGNFPRFEHVPNHSNNTLMECKFPFDKESDLELHVPNHVNSSIVESNFPR